MFTFFVFFTFCSESLCWILRLSLMSDVWTVGALTETTHPAVRHRHPSAHVEQHVLLVQKIQQMQGSGNITI